MFAEGCRRNNNTERVTAASILPGPNAKTLSVDRIKFGKHSAGLAITFSYRILREWYLGK